MENVWDVARHAQETVLAPQRAQFQNAAAGVGILDHLRKQQQEQEVRGILSSNLPQEQKIGELAKSPMGMGVLKQFADIQNTGITGDLHRAQLGEINRKAAVSNNQQQYVNALLPQLTQSQYRGEAAEGGPKPQLFANDAEAMKAMQEAERTNTPFRADVNNPNTTKALIAGAGSALPRGVANLLAGQSGAGQQFAPRPIKDASSPTGWSYFNPRDNSMTPGAPDPTASKVATTDTTAEQPSLTPSGEKVKNDLIRSGASIPKTRRGIIDNEALNSLGKENDAGSQPVSASRAQFASKKGALTANEKDLAAIRPYNEMLDMNGNIAIDLAKKVVQTDVKFANKTINWLRQNAGDNPDAAEFLAQVTIVTTEAARVLNNPRLVGQLTDSARHEMQSVISGDMPLNSLTRVIKRMQLDGKNRVTAMEREHDGLVKSLGGAAPVPTDAVTAPAAPEVQRSKSKSGKPISSKDGGKTWEYD